MWLIINRVTTSLSSLYPPTGNTHSTRRSIVENASLLPFFWIKPNRNWEVRLHLTNVTLVSTMTRNNWFVWTGVVSVVTVRERELFYQPSYWQGMVGKCTKWFSPSRSGDNYYNNNDDDNVYNHCTWEEGKLVHCFIFISVSDWGLSID